MSEWLTLVGLLPDTIAIADLTRSSYRTLYDCEIAESKMPHEDESHVQDCEACQRTAMVSISKISVLKSYGKSRLSRNVTDTGANAYLGKINFTFLERVSLF